jgi:hemerythrin-like domain-containing protein
VDHPDVTMMILVHNAFRRDLDRMRSAATEPEALRPIWLTFSRYLTIHHTAKDEILWPTIQAELGEHTALLAEMADEHALVDPLMQEIDERLAHGALDELPAYFDKLAAVLAAHLEHEESAALPVIQDTLTPQQWAAFGDDQRRRVGIRGAAWFFPWLLDGATPEQVDCVLGLLPPPIRLAHRATWKPWYERRMRAITRCADEVEHGAGSPSG